MDKDKIISELRQENKELRAVIKGLMEKISALEKSNAELQGRLNKNSHNSSKPPSTDIRRTKSLRKNSGRSRGGQKGHEGSVLQMSPIPDKVIERTVDQCECCGINLRPFPATDYERRQVFDIPPLNMEVTEYRSEIKYCPCCQRENKSSFPPEVSARVQYGSNIKQLGVYLTQYQLLPYGRSSEMIEELTGHAVSPGSLVHFTESCSNHLEDFIRQLKAHLVESNVVHSDETGFRFEGKRNWLHVATTEQLTYYMAHKKRGKEAMDEMGILEQYQGVNVHDYWKSYLNYGCTHGLCNVHHLRDLTFCHEQEGSRWAQEMMALLLKIKAKVDLAKGQNECKLSDEYRSYFNIHYDKLVEKGLEEHPLKKKPPGKRGRTKKSKSRNMVERFKAHKEDILRFMNNFNVPFGNNLAERAIRMMRLKQKVSGCFRSKTGADTFATIRSYIDTMRKNGISIMDALTKAVTGVPYAVPMLNS